MKSCRIISGRMGAGMDVWLFYNVYTECNTISGTYYIHYTCVGESAEERGEGCCCWCPEWSVADIALFCFLLIYNHFLFEIKFIPFFVPLVCRFPKCKTQTLPMFMLTKPIPLFKADQFFEDFCNEWILFLKRKNVPEFLNFNLPRTGINSLE